MQVVKLYVVRDWQTEDKYYFDTERSAQLLMKIWDKTRLASLDVEFALMDEQGFYYKVQSKPEAIMVYRNRTGECK